MNIVGKYFHKNIRFCAHFVSSKQWCAMCQNDLWVNRLQFFLITGTTLGLCELLGDQFVETKRLFDVQGLFTSCRYDNRLDRMPGFGGMNFSVKLKSIHGSDLFIPSITSLLFSSLYTLGHHYLGLFNQKFVTVVI